MYLVDLLRPKTLVELGTYQGTSYCAFCQAVKELGLDTCCYAVDTWAGDAHSGHYGPVVLANLREHHDKHYGSFSHLLQSTFDDALDHFADGSIDLLHLDGFHTYEVVSHDVESWLPKMSERGVMVLHDTDERISDFGVWKLFSEVKQLYPHFEFFHGHGLGVLAVGQQFPEALRELVDASEETSAIIRGFFFQQGLHLATEERISIEREIARFEKAQCQNELEHTRAHTTFLSEQTEAVRQELARHLEVVSMLQSELVQAREAAQTQLEELHHHTAHLQNENDYLKNELKTAAAEMATLGNSRGVRVINMARAGRYLLSTQGPKAATKQAVRWLSGERGYWKRATMPPTAAPAPPSSGDWSLRDSHLPDDMPFAGVSIVIPILNALDVARACVESLYRAAGSVPFEVIAIDNGSQPEVLAWLKAQCQQKERFYFLSLSNNLGFAKAVNLGLKHARGQYLVIHNSDTVVTTGWLDALVQAAERDPSLGIVSPVTNYCGEGPQNDEAAKGLPVEKAEAFAASIRSRTSVFPVPARLVFFSVLVKRDVIKAVGTLDEDFGLGNYEDEEYCIRAKVGGFTLGIAQNAFVYHHGSTSFKKNKIDHTLWMNQNLGIYLRKLSQTAITLPPRAQSATARTRGDLSVVVRTRNRPEALKAALASLANQTLDAFEVVVVNDGGQDVADILQSFEPYLPITYVYHREGKGPAPALNAGVQAAKGYWLAYLDDDDIVYPPHLETLQATLREAGPEAHFAYSNYCQAVMQGHGLSATHVHFKPMAPWKFNARKLQVENFLPPNTWLHSRACLEEVGGFDEDFILIEDWDFLVKASKRHMFYPTQRFTAEYHFFLDGSNITLNQRHKYLEQLQKLYARHPSTDHGVLAGRKFLVEQVTLQSAKIDKFRHLAEHQVMTPAEASRQILTILSGIQLDQLDRKE